ncbi:hypothetical protein EI42_05751 [Thermosporothrix hazakensis]|jgi:3'-phosphoadenosine 5'-phosphosulfate sulfotransferase (PAPS reductase)/FAD synthetase|uniref:3'-phosphoadenosine 5'-phosphosulfate sulfotransferase (PAPS reductase)/FAD synthetase n=1 Tax=Thermosporothrix hazakensis TaxID=644383 RepID=A0A326TX74_THEHA|nr:hypothetical protein [Thermosporothrix hazakensis]PZW20990.1 hypothetical protein EI42_05751 [Thermosporothrix hazakensis]GCE49273.1 hypothetical protein KTH_41420 [Thermosporothrix hazakensis]
MSFSIFPLTSANMAPIAQSLHTPHIVSLSGGLASAVAAERVIQRYGREQVALWFADTRYEDEDLYRFLHDLMARWQGALYWYTDGRTPLDVAEQKKLIPCNMAAPCSYELKVRPFRQFIAAMPCLPMVHIGLDRHENRRLASVKASYAKAMPDVQVEYPLLWEPYEQRPLMDVCLQDWHITPPRLYSLGFKHNNCGGRCVRQGYSEWLRLLRYFPARFDACQEWEEEQRAKGGPRAHRSFCAMVRQGQKQAYPLREIRTRLEGALW